MAALAALNRVTLPRKQHEAAVLVAEGKWSLDFIAGEVGVAPSTLDLWCRKPQFRETVLALRDEFRQRAMDDAPFVDKRARVVALDALARDLLAQVRDSRYQIVLGLDDSGQPIMGFDRHRVAALRGCLDDIAKELGDRRDDGGGVEVVVKVYGDPRMAQPFEADWSDAPPPQSSADR